MQNLIPDDNKETNKVEYNLSAIKINLIGTKVGEADYYWMNGNIERAFNCWKCIFLKIRSRLTSEQDNKCKKIEFNFRIPRISENLLQIKGRKNHYYEKYVKILEEMLKEYGFDMKEQESSEYFVH